MAQVLTGKNYLLITQVYPPETISGALQVRDLAYGFLSQGHRVLVVVADETLKRSHRVSFENGVQVLRLYSFPARGKSYFRRALSEFVMPIVMYVNFLRSGMVRDRYDGVMWYSPSIFHGLLAYLLKLHSGCKGYLILRDIFPDWAVDLGVLRKNGLPHMLFSCVADFQYMVADVIGVQSIGNLKFFTKWKNESSKRLEVLNNWLAYHDNVRCSIRLKDSNLSNRTILVYAGNMGVAQGLHQLIDIAIEFKNVSNIGFLFVGRGSEVGSLKKKAQEYSLDNLLFHDEIPSDQIQDLYSQCHIGILSLDLRHKSHNIPGKFLTYLQSGLPVVAIVNPGNDLVDIIERARVGRVCTNYDIHELKSMIIDLVSEIDNDAAIKQRCHSLFKSQYSVDRAVSQIVSALERT